MARQRTIQPSFWKDTTTSKWPTDSRLLFIALWNESDDYGVVKIDPTSLHALVFPGYNVDVRQVLQPLVDDSQLKLFAHEDKHYGYMPIFVEQQVVNRKSKKRNPEQKEDSLVACSDLEVDQLFSDAHNSLQPENAGTSTEHSVSPHGDFPPRAHTRGRKKNINLTSINLNKEEEDLNARETPPPSVISRLMAEVWNPGKATKAKQYFDYYNEAGARTTKGWHKKHWDTYKLTVMACVGLVNDSEMKMIIDFAATNPRCRYKGSDDLFIYPALVFGRQGEDPRRRLDALLSRAKQWRSSRVANQPASIPEHEKERNRQKAASQLTLISKDPLPYLNRLSGSQAHRTKVLQGILQELQKRSVDGQPIFDYFKEVSHA